MENLLEAVASSAEIDARIEMTFDQLFAQESPRRIYFETGNEAYIVDTGNDDVRTEGMSYGLMLAVQLDKPDMFARLWRWVTHYMAAPESSVNSGYFIWSVSPEGLPNDDGPAPDGEEFFAASLLLAERRWGVKAYGDAARRILHEMVHKGESQNGGNPMFESDNYYIRFVPSLRLTDPSYHLPHFYDLYADLGNPEDSVFFKKAATASRQFLIKCAHPLTGLTPEYADYDGLPHDIDGHWAFFSDAYRTAANIGLDWAWTRENEAERQIALRIQRFFEKYLTIGDISQVPVFKVDGTPVAEGDQNGDAFPPLVVKHYLGLWSTLAQASLASYDLDRDLAGKWLQAFWRLKLRTDKYRYYDNLLYFFALLALSGRYKKSW